MEEKTFIYILRLLPEYQKEENWSAEIKRVVGQHFDHLSVLKEKGTLVYVGKTQYGIENPENFGLVVFKSENIDTAIEMMNTDPAIQQRIMIGELHPFAEVL